MTTFERLVKNILDIPGTEGIAFFDREGNLLSKSMPDLYLDDVFADLGRRIVATYEVVEENFTTPDDFILKFPGRWIMMRRGADYTLLLLTTDEVNLMSLKIVTNMALKQLKLDMFGPMPVLEFSSPETDEAAAVAPTAEVQTEEETAPEPEPVVEEKKTPAKKRFYRGAFY